MAHAVSIIIPAYNTPILLFENCIESIINQTFSDFELIIVDDGSAEEFAEKIDEIAAKDARIKVFHQTNKGVSEARNFGMEQACGEYLFFVDADDCVNKFWLEFAVKIASEQNLDIVYGCVVMCEKSAENQSADFSESAVVEKENLWKIQNALLTGKFPELENLKRFDLGAAGKLYRKSCAGGALFPVDVRISEDQVFNHTVLNNAEKCVVVNSEAYYYIYNSSSVSHSYHSDAVDEIGKAMEMIGKKLVSENNLQAYYFRVIEDMFNAIEFAYFCGGKNKKSFFEKVSGVKYAKSNPRLSEALKKIKLKKFGNLKWKYKTFLLKTSAFLFVVNKLCFKLFKS